MRDVFQTKNHQYITKTIKEKNFNKQSSEEICIDSIIKWGKNETPNW